MPTKTTTMIDALNDEEGRRLIDTIEDCLASWNGRERYASMIAICIDELREATGYEYQLD